MSLTSQQNLHHEVIELFQDELPQRLAFLLRKLIQPVLLALSCNLCITETRIGINCTTIDSCCYFSEEQCDGKNSIPSNFSRTSSHSTAQGWKSPPTSDIAGMLMDTTSTQQKSWVVVWGRAMRNGKIDPSEQPPSSAGGRKTTTTSSWLMTACEQQPRPPRRRHAAASADRKKKTRGTVASRPYG